MSNMVRNVEGQLLLYGVLDTMLRIGSIVPDPVQVELCKDKLGRLTSANAKAAITLAAIYMLQALRRDVSVHVPFTI